MEEYIEININNGIKIIYIKFYEKILNDKIKMAEEIFKKIIEEDLK